MAKNGLSQRTPGLRPSDTSLKRLLRWTAASGSTRAGKLPFGKWAAECYAARIDLRDSSRARDELYLRLHVLPYFETTPLARLSVGTFRNG